MKKSHRKNTLIGILTIILIVLLAVIPETKLLLKKSYYQEISYTDFLKKVDKNEIKSVVIGNSDNFMAFTSKNKNAKDTTGYLVPNPKYSSFKKDLLLKNISVTTTNTNTINIIIKLIVSLLPIFLIYLLLTKFVNSNMNSNNFKMLSENSFKVPNVKFCDIAGNKEVKEEMHDIIKFLKNPKKYTDRGVVFPKGVLLVGPPGTGKTLTAKAIAGECNVPFINVSGSDFIEMYAGLGAKRVRELFKIARSKAPCIVFIDEIDAIGTKRDGGSNSNEKNQTINALLTQMDGFNSSDGVLVISATNRVDTLDEALIRAGRFDKHIHIPLPESYERLEIIKRYIKDVRISNEVSLETLSKQTIGFSGADINNLINEANFISVSKDKDKIDNKDIDDAFFKILMKGHKKPLSENEEETKLVAWHETGHTLANLLLPNGDEVNKVTIIPSSSGAGGVTITTPSKMKLVSKDYIETKIKVLYAGRIGEYLLLNDNNKITTGASQDIKQATELIKGYICDYGMNETYGMLNLNDLNINNEIIIEEATKLSKKLYNEIYELLKSKINLFEIVVEKLLDKETLTGEEIKKLIQNHIIEE